MATIHLLIILIILCSIVLIYQYKLLDKVYLKKNIKYKFYSLIILLCFVIFIFNYKYFETFDISNCIVLTYENKTTDISTKNLIQLCKKNNFKCKIIGQNKEWNGWYGRTIEYINELNNIDEDTYVVLSDGRDVLINEDCSTFLKKAIKLCSNKKIVFGAERIYSQDSPKLKKFMDDYSISRTIHDYKYINFGLIFGKSKNIKEFLLKLNIKKDDIDQGLATKEFYDNPDDYILDYDQTIFNNNNPKDCHLKWDKNKNKFKNTITNTYPTFLHFPGQGWDCYKKCSTMLFNNLDYTPIYIYK